MKLLLVLVSYCLAYNLSPEGGHVFSDPYFSPESYFGYTVALRRNPSRLIVGAPRSYSTKKEYRFIRQPGVVFSLNLSTNTSQEFTLEFDGERNHSEYYDLKEDAWIGGAFDVNDYSNSMTVCGSRWANQIHNGYRLMNGVCYVVDDDKSALSEGKKLIPLLNEANQQFEVQSNLQFYYAYGQAGFSVHITPNEEILLGAPGVLLWTGTVIKYDLSHSNQPVVPNPYFSEKMQSEGYFGYVVSSGKLTRRKILYVASAPRSAGYRGQVYLYEFPTTNNASFSVHLTLEGFHIGEYFGSSLAVVDFDNDGLDDLVVGAPLHSTDRSGDAGAVYVYSNPQLWNLKQPLTITGSNSQGARFGTAIGGLADLDNDGFKDVVIGAPYEGKTGVVYVYRGSSQGLSTVYSQRITAENFGALQGFGFSISRGIDIDGNSYPDIAIGAYASGHAVIVKSKPVTQLQVRLENSSRRINFTSTQIILEACASYDGKFVPNNLDIKLSMEVDAVHRRAVFSTGNSSSSVIIVLTKGQERCKSQILQVVPISSWTDSGRFAIFPISLIGSLDKACSSCSIIDPGSNSSVFDKFQVMATCDKDQCIPSWKVSANFFNIQKPFVIGSAKSALLRVYVWNEGDNAHILQVKVELPKNIKPRTTPAVCTLSGNSLSCCSGLLINKNETKYFDINLDVSDVDEGIIQVNATTHAYDSVNVTEAVAVMHAVRIPRLGLVGLAAPSITVVPFNVSRNQIIRITHRYQTYCAGFTPVPNVTLELIAPFMVYERKQWRDILNVSYSAFVGEKTVKCQMTKLDANVRRAADSERVLSCKDGSKHVKCVRIFCSCGTLIPESDGLDLAFQMDVRLSTINLFLRTHSVVHLNTSAVAFSEGTSLSPIYSGIATILAGPVPEKKDPWFYWYIAFAVIVALALLLVIVLLFWKWGFFKRTEIPTNTDDEVEVILYNAEKNQENEQQLEGNLIIFRKIPIVLLGLLTASL